MVERKKKRLKEKTPLSMVLKAIMEERGLTLTKLGTLAGISKSTIAGWIAGQAPLDLVAVKRLANVLKISMAYLTTGQEDQIEQKTSEIVELLQNGKTHEGYYRVLFQKLEPKK